jgi:hypothetical protein
VNMQLPSYWRKLFAEFAFRTFDPIRPRVRDDRRIAYWFRQNMLLFASASGVQQHPELDDSAIAEGAELEWINAELAASPKYLLRILPSAIHQSIRTKMRIQGRQVRERFLSYRSNHR